MRFSRGLVGAAVVLLTGGLLVGCASSTGSNYKFDPLSQNGGSSVTAPAAPSPGPALIPAAGGDGGQELAASKSASQSGRILRVGDGVTITFQDLGNVSPVLPVDTTIKEDGTITLIYNKQFHAANKTVGQLEGEIRDAYVPAYFVNMTPTISTKERWFYVDGEVKAPGRQVYLNKMTVLGAIATVGGFTDYARKRKIELTRANGQKFTVDFIKAQKKPELDLEVFPDDRVFVRKRIL